MVRNSLQFASIEPDYRRFVYEVHSYHIVVPSRGSPTSALLFHEKKITRKRHEQGQVEAIRDRKFKKLRKYSVLAGLVPTSIQSSEGERRDCQNYKRRSQFVHLLSIISIPKKQSTREKNNFLLRQDIQFLKIFVSLTRVLNPQNSGTKKLIFKKSRRTFIISSWFTL